MKIGLKKTRSNKPAPLAARRTQHHGSKAVTLPISSVQIMVAAKKRKKRDRGAFGEDLLAATSPRYLASIRAARKDYRRGRVLSHEDVFGKLK